MGNILSSSLLINAVFERPRLIFRETERHLSVFDDTFSKCFLGEEENMETQERPSRGKEKVKEQKGMKRKKKFFFFFFFFWKILKFFSRV